MREIKILLIEDDSDHAEIITEVLAENGIDKEIILVRDGQQALDFFKGIGIDGIGETQSNIDLIILDLKLPKIDGMDVLKFLKKNTKYCSIPVVILSTSSEVRTIVEGYKNGVNSFITKPISYEGFVGKIKTLKEYWLQTCVLPVQ
ncbi:MAG: response regulator [Candidatus Scalinduaceae bacterium]